MYRYKYIGECVCVFGRMCVLQEKEVRKEEERRDYIVYIQKFYC